MSDESHLLVIGVDEREVTLRLDDGAAAAPEIRDPVPTSATVAP